MREWEEAAGLRSDAVKITSRRAEQLFEALPAEERARVRFVHAEGSGRASCLLCANQPHQAAGHVRRMGSCGVAKLPSRPAGTV